LNRNFFYIFLILLFTGLFNVIIGNNTTELFFKVFTGVALSYFFYYYVIAHFKFNIEQLFRWYLKGAYIAALIGWFQFISFQVGYVKGYWLWDILNKWSFVPGGLFGIRVNSVFSEPTHLGAVMSAAFFVSVYNLFRKETYVLSRFQSLLIFIIYFLSFSGLAQTGVFLTLLFLAISYGLFRYVAVVVPAIIIVFNVLYNNVEDFRDRFDSLVGLYSGEEFVLGKTHGSSFILFNNYRVATENFKSNFVFGTGIGSHPVAFEKYSMAKHIKTYGFNLNSADANSMFLRLLSETGLFGVLLFVVLMYRCYVRRNENDETYHWIISNAVLIMILLNLFRQGHYFLNGFPFFVLLYYFNYESYQKHRAELYAEEAAQKSFVSPPLQNIELGR
jgi:O-antigen ligase